MNEQSRINAMISYFFLGPLFLLAKKGTPLADPYVRGHALRSTFIILISLGLYCCYAFFLRGWLDFSVMMFHIHDIMLTVLCIGMLIYLGIGAHHAYRGIVAHQIDVLHNITIFGTESPSTNVENEEQKIRIIASMIPFLGIYIAKRYPVREIIRGRIIGSTFAAILILVSILFRGEAFIFSLVMISVVLIFTSLSVNLYMKSSFSPGPILSRLPSYVELESHIFATMRSIVDFFRIAFGGEGRRDYDTLYQDELSRVPSSYAPMTQYFMPPMLIGLPLWNILTLPSLWIDKYREYREYIISGLLITCSMIGISIFSGTSSPYLLLFLFPIFHMMTYASTDLTSYIPGIHIIMRIISMIRTTREKIEVENTKKEEVSFNYEVK